MPDRTSVPNRPSVQATAQNKIVRARGFIPIARIRLSSRDDKPSPSAWMERPNEPILVMAKRVASWPSGWITTPGGAGLVMTTMSSLEKRARAIELDCFVASPLAMTSKNHGELVKQPKLLTADYADYADNSSYPDAQSGLEPTTTLGIRFIRAIRDGFFSRLKERIKTKPSENSQRIDSAGNKTRTRIRTPVTSGSLRRPGVPNQSTSQIPQKK